MKQYFFFLYAAGFLILGASLVSAGTTTLTTYYPAPDGNYNKVSIGNTLTMLSQATACTAGAGNIVLNNTNGTLEVCDPSNIALAVTSAGNVGIGTTAPLSKLEVDSTTNANSIEIRNSSLGGRASWIFYPITNGSNTDMRLWEYGTSSGDRVTFQSGGNVGIGTTSPGANLDIQRVAGDSSDILRIGSNQNYYFGFARDNTTGALKIQGNQTGYNNIWLAPTSGNVGIGTTAPQGTLDVGPTGQIVFNGNAGWSATGANGLFWDSAGFGSYSIYKTAGSWSAPNYQQLELNWPTGIIIDGGSAYGNSGIHLNGQIYTTGSLSSYGAVSINGTKNTWSGINFRSGSTNYGTLMAYSNGTMGFFNSADTAWNSYADGSANVYATSFTATSDQRLKKDIRPIAHALDKVQRLNGVAFTWKKNGAKDIGVIAQDVEKVLPEIVRTDLNGMKGVEYGHLAGLFIEAIKEQQKEIKDQQKEIEELGKKVEGKK